jgi:hypothetical protein
LDFKSRRGFAYILTDFIWQNAYKDTAAFEIRTPTSFSLDFSIIIDYFGYIENKISTTTNVKPKKWNSTTAELLVRVCSELDLFYPGWSWVTIILSQTVQCDQGKNQTVYTTQKCIGVGTHEKFPIQYIYKKEQWDKSYPTFLSRIKLWT